MGGGNDSGAEPLSLDWMLGLDPCSVRALDGRNVFYSVSSVGVVYNAAARSQTLLRGHRNAISAVAVVPHRRTIFTGCSGENACLIAWDVDGTALAVVDAPHRFGIAALDVSPCGRWLASVSTPYTMGASSLSVEAFQEVTIWRVDSITGRPLRGEGEGEDSVDGDDEPPPEAPPPAFVRVVSSLVPVEDVQHHVVFNHATAESAAVAGGLGIGAGGLATAIPEPSLQASVVSVTGRHGTGATTQPGHPLVFELATTGPASTVFWTLSPDEAAESARVTTEIAAGLRKPGQPGTIIGAAAVAAAANGAIVVGGVVIEVEEGGDPTRAVQNWRLSGVPLSVPGCAGLEPLAAVLASKRPGTSLAALAPGSQAGVGRAPAPQAPLPPGSRRCTVTTYIPPTGTGLFQVTAVTATDDGRVVLWSSVSPASVASAPPSRPATAALGAAGAPLPAIEDVVSAAAGRTLMKIALLSPPPKGASGSEGGEGASSGAGSNPEEAVAAGIRDGQRGTADAAAAAGASQAVTTKGGGGGVAPTGEAPLAPALLPRPANAGEAALLEVPSTSAADADPRPLRIAALAVTPCRRFLAAGTADGAVRFYDLYLRLIAWFEELDAGPVCALSFVPGTGATAAAGLAALAPMDSSFLAPPVAAAAAAGLAAAGGAGLPDFLVASSRALLVKVAGASFESASPEARRGDILLEGVEGAVVGIAPYPAPSTHLAVAVSTGMVQVWDTASKQLLLVRELVRVGDANDPVAQAAAVLAINAGQVPPRMLHRPTAIAMDATGRFLAVGTVEGAVLILKGGDLTDAQPFLQAPHAGFAANPSSGGPGGGRTGGPPAASRIPYPITRLAFSPDGYHLAAADVGRHVALYRYKKTVTRHFAARSATAVLKGTGTRVSKLKELSATATGGGAKKEGKTTKAWEVMDASAAGGEGGAGAEASIVEDVVSAFVYVGRAKAHSGGVTTLAWSPLPRGVQPSGQHDGGLEGDAFWSPATIGTPPPGIAAAAWSSWGITEAVPAAVAAGTVQYAGSPAHTVAGVLSRSARAGLSVLTSTGTDGRLVTYDVGASSLTAGLVLAGSRPRVGEATDVPTAGMWYPAGDAPAPPPTVDPRPGPTGATMLLASASYKYKLLRLPRVEDAGDAEYIDSLRAVTSVSKPARGQEGAALGGGDAAPLLRQVTLGPAFGGAISRLTPVTVARGDEPGASAAWPTPALAWATDDGVVGLSALPLTGNPFAMVGALAHPGPVLGLAVLGGGGLLASSALDPPAASLSPAGATGGEAARPSALGFTVPRCGSVALWRLAPDALTAAATPASEAEADDAFLTLIEGGQSGAAWKTLTDAFVYSQLARQGLDTTSRRAVGDTIPLPDVGPVLRAAGYYPTQAELITLMGEVRSATLRSSPEVNAAGAGVPPPPYSAIAVTLPTVVRLLVNHRPLEPVTRPGIVKSLYTLSRYFASGTEMLREPKVDVDAADVTLKVGALAQLLSSTGEAIPARDLAAIGLSGGMGENGTVYGGGDGYDSDSGTITRPRTASFPAASVVSGGAAGGGGLRLGTASEDGWPGLGTDDVLSAEEILTHVLAMPDGEAEADDSEGAGPGGLTVLGGNQRGRAAAAAASAANGGAGRPPKSPPAPVSLSESRVPTAYKLPGSRGGRGGGGEGVSSAAGGGAGSGPAGTTAGKGLML